MSTQERQSRAKAPSALGTAERKKRTIGETRDSRKTGEKMVDMSGRF